MNYLENKVLLSILIAGCGTTNDIAIEVAKHTKHVAALRRQFTSLIGLVKSSDIKQHIQSVCDASPLKINDQTPPKDHAISN